MTETFADPERRAALNRLLTARSEAHVVSVCEAMAGAGADVIVLKGVVTRTRYYRPDEGRIPADLDLLVDPAHASVAGEVLRTMGYVPSRVTGHADEWSHSELAPIDLHITLPFATPSPRRVWELLDEHRSTVDVGGVRVNALAPTAHVVHLCIHHAQGGLAADTRAAEDLFRAVSNVTPEQRAAAEDLAATLGVEDVVGAAIAAVLDEPDVARSLPVRKLARRGTAAFLRSPVPLAVRWREVRRVAGAFRSDDATVVWLERRGRSWPAGRLRRVAVKCERLGRAVWHELGG